MKNQRPSQHGGKSPTSVAKPAISQHTDDNGDFGPPVPSSSAASGSTLRRLLSQPAETVAPDGSDSTACTGTFQPSVDLDPEETVNHADDQGLDSETKWDPDPPTVGTEVICDGENHVWKARVESTPIKIITTIGLIENVLSDGSIADAACDVLRQMAADVEELMSNPTRLDTERDDYWLPDGFLEKHESVHNKHVRKALKENYDQLVEDLEGITEACEDFSQSEAETEMEADINTAIKDFQDALKEFHDKEQMHDPKDDFLEAHQDFLQPWKDKIDAELAFKECN